MSDLQLVTKSVVLTQNNLYRIWSWVSKIWLCHNLCSSKLWFGWEFSWAMEWPMVFWNTLAKYNSSIIWNESFCEKRHSKWALVGDSGGLPGLENAVKRWVGPIGLICFSMWTHSFPLMCEPVKFTGSSIEAKCKPVKNIWASQWKTYKQAREKHP